MKFSLFTLPLKWRPAGRLAVAGVGLACCLLAMGACTAGDDVEPDHTAMLPEDQRVSSVPWNKPQGWENNSQLGSLANDPRIGGGQPAHQ